MPLSPILVKDICDAVLNDWRPEYDFLPDHFRLPLTKSEFYSTSFNTLNNRTISDYIKEKNEGSKYYYSTFKRRAEIIISNNISNLVLGNVDNTTILNALSQVNSKNVKAVTEFFIDNDKFDITLWSDFLLEHNQILGIEFADEIFLFSTLCYIRNIISFYGLLPFQVEFSIDDDCIFFYCVDFANKKFTYFVSLTNPLASHFLN
ncbi:hypothetical protein RFK58_10455 [Streptococcus suis]|uniref:hypothetical protein n=1 Tax=Streptococcus suis TaxID=1307 RepID=UPI002A7A17BC|nr:hypothetical protein [Streptococcus suis]HEM3669635.1 hypothetical protein [Streptococcus suis]HEM3686735.1 hypothetical protein [Streptococcus suis]HEM3693268.1 hypothetical protein [Streptococcus suis]